MDVIDCYLCGLPLDSNTTQDHIIPDKFFKKIDPHRPQLRVHFKCNNLKSMDDEWFVRQIQLRSSLNPDAENEFSKMMDKAIQEKKDAYIIGKQLHYYKLAKTIFNDVSWGIELEHEGQSLIQMKILKKNNDRLLPYLKKMCKGLYIKNVSDAKLNEPEITIKHYSDLEIRTNSSSFIKVIRNLINMS